MSNIQFLKEERTLRFWAHGEPHDIYCSHKSPVGYDVIVKHRNDCENFYYLASDKSSLLLA